MNASQTSFLSEILEGETIPSEKLAYFRVRLRSRIYSLVIRRFLNQEKAGGMTRADLARRIGRNPAQITRWFTTPSNWTLDTISDLMLAMGTELNFSVGSLVEEKNEQDLFKVEEVVPVVLETGTRSNPVLVRSTPEEINRTSLYNVTVRA